MAASEAWELLRAAVDDDDPSLVSQAAQAGLDAYASDPATGLRPMASAVEGGADAVVEALLALQMGSGDTPSVDGRTSFIRALELGHTAIARRFHERRTYWSSAEIGQAPAALLVGSDDAELLGRLLDDGWPPTAGKEGPGILRLARRLGRTRSVAMLEARSAPAALVQAVIRDRISEVRAWLAAGGSPEILDLETGRSLLLHAAEAGATAVGEALVDAGADVDRADAEIPTRAPLLVALRAGRASFVRLLLARKSKLTSWERVDALTALVDGPADDGSLVPLLIGRGALLMRKKGLPHEAALLARRAEEGGRHAIADALREAEEIAETLGIAVLGEDPVEAKRAIDRGANVEEPDPVGGGSWLATATIAGSIDVARELLASGASAWSDWSVARSPAALAMSKGMVALVRSIVEVGGMPPEAQCLEFLEILAARPEDYASVADAILSSAAGASVVTQPGALTRLVKLAATSGHPSVIRLFMSRGGLPDGVLEAARRGASDVVRALLDAGGRLNASDERGNRALHLAVLSDGDAAGTVRALVEAGCMVEATNYEKKDACALAAERERPELACMITELSKETGPRWLRDARRAEPGPWYYEVHLSKANGLGFNPFDVDQPLMMGGDYDGFVPTPASEACLEQWRAACARCPELVPSSQWFMPYFEKLVRREDFGLDAFERSAPASARRHRR